jgi:plasmid stability protein
VKAKGDIQYTLRQVPREVDEGLRARSKREGKSLNQTALELLAAGLQLHGEAVRHRDLDFMAGTWVEDPAFDAAIEAQNQIDPELWK